MTRALYLCPYKVVTGPAGKARYCAMDDFTTTIRTDALFAVRPWDETEILGDQAVVLVNAAPATLATIGGTAGFTRIPATALDTALSTLTGPQRTALRNVASNAGYTAQEIQDAVGDLSTVTLRDFLRFLATRRLRPRTVAGNVTVDGPPVSCKAPDILEV